MPCCSWDLDNRTWFQAGSKHGQTCSICLLGQAAINDKFEQQRRSGLSGLIAHLAGIAFSGLAPRRAYPGFSPHSWDAPFRSAATLAIFAQRHSFTPSLDSLDNPTAHKLLFAVLTARVAAAAVIGCALVSPGTSALLAHHLDILCTSPRITLFSFAGLDKRTSRFAHLAPLWAKHKFLRPRTLPPSFGSLFCTAPAARFWAALILSWFCARHFLDSSPGL